MFFFLFFFKATLQKTAVMTLELFLIFLFII